MKESVNWIKSVHGKFDTLVALVLTVIMALIVLLALARLGLYLTDVISLEQNLMEYRVFQTLFGMVMVVLIALEFTYIVFQIAQGASILSQMRAVVIVAVLALVRKFIILDVTQVSAMTVISISAAIVALSALYWTVVAAKPAKPLDPTS